MIRLRKPAWTRRSHIQNLNVRLWMTSPSRWTKAEVDEIRKEGLIWYEEIQELFE